MEKKYGNTLTIILVVAIVAIVAVLGFFAYRIYTSNITEKNAKDKVAEFDEKTASNSTTNTTNETGNTNTDTNTSSGNTSLSEVLSGLNTGGESSIYDKSGSSDSEDDGTYYESNGRKYKVIGTISISKIDIKYPIFEECSSETLEIGIAAFYPDEAESAVNQIGNLVLFGHNYKNSKFFSKLDELTSGDIIKIKDTSGTTVSYQVYNTYETTDSDVSYAARDTEGTKEISLSTCSNTSGKRTIVWAREKN